MSLDSSEDRFFSRDYLFLKFETIGGCKAKLKLVFPKQDLIDQKMKKNEDKNGKGGPAMLSTKSKNKLQKDIEYQIAKLITEPRLYENFQHEFKLLKEQKILRKAV